jgi:hypothetical protein
LESELKIFSRNDDSSLTDSDTTLARDDTEINEKRYYRLFAERGNMKQKFFLLQLRRKNINVEDE